MTRYLFTAFLAAGCRIRSCCDRLFTSVCWNMGEKTEGTWSGLQGMSGAELSFFFCQRSPLYN